MTDVPEMIGAYHSLFSILGVYIGDAVFPPQTGFTHPIEKENAKMTAEFMETMLVIKGALATHFNLALDNSRVVNNRLTFVFKTVE